MEKFLGNGSSTVNRFITRPPVEFLTSCVEKPNCQQTEFTVNKTNGSLFSVLDLKNVLLLNYCIIQKEKELQANLLGKNCWLKSADNIRCCDISSLLSIFTVLPFLVI